jgi:hypothetical protein
MFFVTVDKEYFDKLRKEQYPELADIFFVQKAITNEDLIHIVDKFFAS